MNGFYLKELQVLGNSKKPATISFNKGLNVISGASDTGKSFIFSCIEFMFGREETPKPIPEAKGYTYVLLELKVYGEEKSICLHRKFNENTIQLKYCKIDDYFKSDSQISNLAIRHNSKNEANISRFLLKLCGLDEKLLKFNSNNIKVALSFSDIRKLTCIHEERIITESSPFYYDSQNINQTKNKSLLKFFLTGKDDSDLKTTEKEEITETRISSKLEVLKDQLEMKLEKYHELIELIVVIPTEATGQEFEQLNLKLLETNNELEYLGNTRNSIYKTSQDLIEKSGQNKELYDRFLLLASHYKSDLERLQFVEEGGDFLEQLNNQVCPVCFQLIHPEHEHEIIDNEKIVIAINAETSKIKRKLIDLEDTTLELNEKISLLETEILELNNSYIKIQEKISAELNPQANYIKSRLQKIINAEKDNLRKTILLSEIEELESRIWELQEDLTSLSKGKKPSIRISRIQLDKLCELIEKRLKLWHYDKNLKVSFDSSYQEFDIIIGNKLRKSYGKGKRGVSYAACILGIMDYCYNFKRPFSNCLVFDSPLTAYESNKTLKDKEELDTGIINSFYKNLSKIKPNTQVVILDNKRPSEEIINVINHIEFTGNKKNGRKGFFPE